MRRVHARAIFDAGVAAADPGHCVHQTLAVTGDELRCGPLRFPLDTISSLRLVGAGKATAAMAAAAEAILGDRIDCGAINTKYGHALPLARVETFEAGHPIPDEAGVAGARRQLELLANLDPDALVLGLFSGGGSALLPAPAEGLTLAEKQETTRLLLACGATIDEINALRKHLSAIKGGLLARVAAPARVVSLMLSDVIGDPLDTIASGPTHPDATTFGDCLAIVDHYDLRHQLPASIRQHLETGTRGEQPETPKSGDPCFARAESLVIGNSRLAIDAAAEKAKALGYEVLVLTSRLQGEARHAATALVSIAQETAETDRPIAQPACLIAGGETTVTLRGDGKGGRNQELALAASLQLDGWPTITLLSGGTDGTDGPTDAAGALADGQTLSRARAQGLDARAFLDRHDSYPFFAALDDLVITGPTGTNVMDLQIVLIA
ncbi:MAG: glycerate kinase [Candidatus Latescibacteria bacterium]|nr:glycerate kinase [Candidatus Latescibacterota bacterium]